MGEHPPREGWSDWGGEGPPLVFVHANGFPPATYRQLLERLRGRFHVATFAACPLWPDSDASGISSWKDLAGDLQPAIGDRGLQEVVGVGHSPGGTLSIMAAAADSTLFGALALIDPVVFAGVRLLYWGAFKHLGFGHRLPLIRGARRRRDHFRDLEAVRSTYVGKSVFVTWNPRVLEDYVQAAFREALDGGVVLCYPRAWEAKIFELTPASVWSDLRRVTVPVLCIRGASSDTFLADTVERVSRELPHATVLELPDPTHFLPMEHPDRVAKRIVDWYSSGDAGGG